MVYSDRDAETDQPILSNSERYVVFCCCCCCCFIVVVVVVTVASLLLSLFVAGVVFGVGDNFSLLQNQVSGVWSSPRHRSTCWASKLSMQITTQ